MRKFAFYGSALCALALGAGAAYAAGLTELLGGQTGTDKLVAISVAGAKPVTGHVTSVGADYVVIQTVCEKPQSSRVYPFSVIQYVTLDAPAPCKLPGTAPAPAKQPAAKQK